jgi:CspA family cold shock protein
MPFFSKNIPELTTTDLAELLAQHAVENVRLEFKREVPGPEETLKKLSGFANTFGGYLIVGAAASSSDGRLIGFTGVAPQSNFKQTIIQRCYEGIWPPIEALVSDPIPAPNTPGKVCYVIYVPESLEAPHFLNHRKGAWVRTDEFSQRFETRLATFEELQHLINRRYLAIQRREQLYERAARRFESLVASDYADHPGTTGSIGATFALSLCPLFPLQRLIEDRDLLSLLTSESVPWRQVGFPRARDSIITQHESVLVLHPTMGFSIVEADVWGYLFYACEIEHLEGNEERPVTGIHLDAFLGFTTQENGPDVFVHYSAITDTTGYKSLNEGDQVEFQITQGAKGPQAQSVKKALTAARSGVVPPRCLARAAPGRPLGSPSPPSAEDLCTRAIPAHRHPIRQVSHRRHSEYGDRFRHAQSVVLAHRHLRRTSAGADQRGGRAPGLDE